MASGIPNRRHFATAIRNVRGGIELPEPGRYRIDLTVTDMKSQASLDHAAIVTVVGSAPAQK